MMGMLVFSEFHKVKADNRFQDPQPNLQVWRSFILGIAAGLYVLFLVSMSHAIFDVASKHLGFDRVARQEENKTSTPQVRLSDLDIPCSVHYGTELTCSQYSQTCFPDPELCLFHNNANINHSVETRCRCLFNEMCSWEV